MCLAVPALVVSVEDRKVTVDVMGNTRSADISLLEDVSVGDYLLIHAGFAIQKMQRQEAEETLQIFKDLEETFGEGKD